MPSVAEQILAVPGIVDGQRLTYQELSDATGVPKKKVSSVITNLLDRKELARDGKKNDLQCYCLPSSTSKRRLLTGKWNKSLQVGRVNESTAKESS